MAYHDWHVGMKVVCVDDAPAGRTGKTRRVLTKGAVYTVHSITTEIGRYGGSVGHILVVELQEVINPFGMFGESDGFAAARFRPVQTRKTDISVFTAMLNHQKQGVDA